MPPQASELYKMISTWHSQRLEKEWTRAITSITLDDFQQCLELFYNNNNNNIVSKNEISVRSSFTMQVLPNTSYRCAPQNVSFVLKCNVPQSQSYESITRALQILGYKCKWERQEDETYHLIFSLERNLLSQNLN